MGLNVPKRGRNPYRAPAGAKGLDASWRLDPIRYDAAVAEAQLKADATGLDVGLFPCDLSKSWSTRFMPAREFRTGDDTKMIDGHDCQIIAPSLKR